MARPTDIVKVQTPATTQQAATTFRSVMTLGFAARLLRGATEFGKPGSDGPFDELEGDPPGFSVYATVPITKYNGSVIHLYAWDRGQQRELKVMAIGGTVSLGLHAHRLIERYLVALTTAVPGTQYAWL